MVKVQRLAVSDRREKPRKQIQHIFKLSHPVVGEWECEIHDLSLSGTFVEGRFTDIVPGDTIKLAFTADTGARIEYRFSSTVIRVAAEGVGLKFLSLNMDTYGALLDLTLQG
ncbi:MAG: PilZ domain-containing protein [Acidiferrobacterales bacterium]